jgi:hypothetical protein
LIEYLFNTKADDALTQFAKWYFGHKPNLPNRPPAEDAVMYLPTISGLTLWRDQQFQVQLFICAPGTVITEHSHPNVDSYEGIMSGEVDFYIAGQQTIEPRFFAANKQGHSKGYGTAARVRPGAPHHAIIGKEGGSFLSIQHWLKGEPTHVGDDWEGKPVSKEHADRIERIAA